MNETSNNKSIKVLLVEDSESVALHIASFLQNAGQDTFTMVHAESLQGAIERLEKDNFEVILLDLGLSDSDGIETFFRMKKSAPDVAIIVFTGETDEDIALEAMRRGAQDYIVKGQADGKLLVQSLRYAVERKRIEQALRDSEAKHRTLLEAMPDMLYRLDPDGVIKYINPAVERLGYTADELIGQHFSKIVHPDDVDPFAEEEERRSGSDPIPDHPTRIDEEIQPVEDDGMTRDMQLRLIPKDWEEGDEDNCLIGSLTSYGEEATAQQPDKSTAPSEQRIASTVGIIKDITIRQRAEQDRDVLEAQLHQSQKMEAIGRLAGGVAHDMNNVLGAIQGSASVLNLSIDSECEEREDVDNILIACKKGQDLTRDLLGFARKGKYRTQSISVNKVAREVQSLLSATIERTISILVDLDEKPFTVRGDRSQIHHALMNVCINAADSMSGSGQIEITTENIILSDVKPLQLMDLPNGPYVEITVVDTGSGIDEETLPMVFEPFFTTKPKGEGTGLGLSMAYGVAKNHGGLLIVESKIGVGTTVRFILPASEDQGQHTRVPAAKLPSRTPIVTGVLVIDDERIIRTSTRRLLQQWGYRVFLAENGEEGVQAYKDNMDQITLVLLDIVMPKMDGTETFHELIKIDPEAKILLSSGYSKDDKVEQLLDAGAVGFIQKPFDVWMFAETLKKAIDPSRDSHRSSNSEQLVATASEA